MLLSTDPQQPIPANEPQWSTSRLHCATSIIQRITVGMAVIREQLPHGRTLLEVDEQPQAPNGIATIRVVMCASEQVLDGLDVGVDRLEVVSFSCPVNALVMSHIECCVEGDVAHAEFDPSCDLLPPLLGCGFAH